MKNDELLNQVIEMIDAEMDNYNDYQTAYALRLKLLNELKNSNSMLIPKPKFNIGDVVKCVVDNEQFIVDDCTYSVYDSEWYYKWCDYSADYHYTEEDLYLVESKNVMITNTELSDDDEIT